MVLTPSQTRHLALVAAHRAVTTLRANRGQAPAWVRSSFLNVIR